MPKEHPRHISSKTIYEKIQKLTAGESIVLPVEILDRPLVIRGLRGTSEAPIVIEGTLKRDLPEPPKKNERRVSPVLQPWPLEDEVRRMTDLSSYGAVFRRYTDDKPARRQANEAAKKREEGGDYPVPAWLADQAMVTLLDCQHVVIKNIAFRQCWPTAIYLERCQHIAFDHLGFSGSTICIGASGRDTHDLLVQNCRWYQSSEMFGGKATWQKVHGSRDNFGKYSGVSIRNDYRHLDGDFFRAWNIFGNVVIRDNWISHCFNAIHFFTRDTDANRTAIDTLSATNVLIARNVFYNVRDNCLEPEDYAWNWVVKHNRFDNCYAPFSLEMQRFGSFYVFGNAGVLENKVAAQGETSNTSPRLWKLKKGHRTDGLSYVFHNSWRLRKRGLAKRIFGGLQHHNNAVFFKKQHTKLSDQLAGGGFFGGTGVGWNKDIPEHAKTFLDAWEGKSFTRRWTEYRIQVNGDTTNDGFVRSFFGTRVYDFLGYILGAETRHADKVFERKLGQSKINQPFKLSAEASNTQSPVEFTLQFPLQFAQENPPSTKIPVSGDVGAVQADGRLFGEDLKFGFLPDFSYLDPVLNKMPIVEPAD